MKLDLFQQVVINRDFPEFKIATRDIAILNDYVVDLEGEEGCVLEIYTARVFVSVVTLPAESIEPFQELRARGDDDLRDRSPGQEVTL